MAEKRSRAAEFDRFQATSTLKSVVLKVIIWIIILLFVFAVVFFAGCRLFAVQNIIVNGLDHYTYSQILDAGNLSKGKVLFLISEKRLANDLSEKYAYIKSVKLEKQYPDTITITLEAEKPQFYIEIQGVYYLLTRSLKVLERYLSEAKLLEAAPEVQFIKVPTVSRAVVCKQLEFADIGKSRHTDEALGKLLDSRLYDDVTAIDFSNRFDMTILYDNRLEIHLGSFEEFDTKLDLVLGMVSACNKYSDKSIGKLEIIFNSDGELQGVVNVREPNVN